MPISLVNGKGDGITNAASFKIVLSLQNVDNTSDANKPISTATQAALDTKKTFDSSLFNFILEGDSIFAGVTSGGATAGNYLQDIIGTRSYFAGRATVTDYAAAGIGISNIIADYPTQAYTKRPAANGGKRAIYCLLIGTNDSTTPATQITNAATLLAHTATAQSDGFEVWLCTLLPRGGAGSINQWEPLNRVIRESNAYDKLIDFNALFKDATNTALFGDNLHPSNLGYVEMADYINGRAWSDQKREALSFGTLAKQDASAVSITGGTISGLTTLGITGSATVTSEGAGGAIWLAQANGAGSGKNWRFGHEPNAVGNTPSSGFGFTYYNGVGFEQGLQGAGPGGLLFGNAFRFSRKTVATLIASPAIDTFATVSDASAFVAGNTVAGGGSVKCMVQYDGTNWKMVLQLY